jgi:hypothetical protein
MSIKTALYSILTNDAGISAIVGDKVYPSAAPTSALCPFIVYTIISDVSTKTMGGATNLTKYMVQISCFSFDSITNTALVSALKSCLDVKQYVGAGFSLWAFEESSIDTTESPKDASEQFSYATNVDYEIQFSTI